MRWWVSGVKGRDTVLFFTGVTLLACALVALAGFYGGAMVWLGLLYITVLTAAMDKLIAARPNPDPEREFPASDALLVALGVAHFALLALTLFAMAGPSGLSVAERFGTGIAAALVFGQVMHPAAHELIHRQARALRSLGKAIYTSLLIGHHASAHVLVHHVHVAGPDDPNSPPLGQGFWRYAGRAAVRSFRAGLQAETKRHAQAGRPVWRHPYVFYVAGAAATAAASLVAFGALGLAALLFLAAYAQLQIYMSDYVQHYGLRRRVLADGRLEPVGPQHSWNAPQAFSSALMLNAPRHSDHHMHPGRAYPALQLDREKMPVLPYPVPIMAVLACWPALWRRVMDPLCRPWQPQQIAGTQTGAIPQAVLEKAKSGGLADQALTELGHDKAVPDPRPSDAVDAGQRAKQHERGGI
jgi:alkane 1-monooxygenase